MLPSEKVLRFYVNNSAVPLQRAFSMYHLRACAYRYLSLSAAFYALTELSQRISLSSEESMKAYHDSLAVSAVISLPVPCQRN